MKDEGRGPFGVLNRLMQAVNRRNRRFFGGELPLSDLEDAEEYGLGPEYLGRSSLNCFSGPPINRAADRRAEEEWIVEQLRNPGMFFVPVWRSKSLIVGDAMPRAVFLNARESGEIMRNAESVIFLGIEDSAAYFAVGIAGEEEPLLPAEIATNGGFKDLKAFGAVLNPGHASLLAYARAMVEWHSRRRFCGDCGSPTESVFGGHMLVCTNEACGQQHFPRTDPAVIVLVSAGDYCLLGRQAAWPKGMYSAIAGFVEPGETLESAVVREVWEETGVRVEDVRYHSSQPWPFPSSLMLGFIAQAATDDIRLDGNELEDARWFSRDEIQIALKDGALRMPSVVSIAYRLIEDWFDADGRGRLKNLI